MTDFEVSFNDDDGVIEPGETGEVTRFNIINNSDMPSPSIQQIRPLILNDK